jgi:hypothetical protein
VIHQKLAFIAMNEQNSAAQEAHSIGHSWLIFGGGMIAPRLRQFLILLLYVIPSGSPLVFAQGTPLKVGPTTTAFFGDGAYSLRGNSITLTPNNGRAAQNGFIRMEEESKDEGRTWVESLYLLRTSEIDGKEYEMKYQRSR